MRPAVCLSATVGTALAGAGVFVATPVAAPAAGSAYRAVALAASPIDAYLDLVTNSFTNLGTIGSTWLADPLPTVVQLIANWSGYLETVVDDLVGASQSFVNGLANLPGQLQTLFEAITTGDFEAAIAMLIITVLSANPLLSLVDHLLGIPYDIAGNFMNAAMAALHAAQVPIGLAVISAGQATFDEIGVVGQDFVHDLQAGDLFGALAQLVEAPAQILNATLNSDTPGLPGLLTPVEDLSQTGFLDALVNYLPQTVAQAIAPDVSDADTGAPLDSVTAAAGALFDAAP